MGIGVPDQHLHDRRVEQLEHLDGRTRARAPDQIEALAERRTAVGRVLAAGRHPERLAEVLLVQAPHGTVRFPLPVVAGDEQAVPIGNAVRVHRGRVHAYAGGEAHRERLVLGRGREAGDGRLEDVRGRLPRPRQRDPPADQDDGELRLRPGERQPQAARAGQHRPGTELPENAGQLLLVERRRRLAAGRGRDRCRRPRLALPTQGQRTGHVATQPLEQCELVARRHAEDRRDRVALRTLGQQSFEEGPTRPGAERLRALRQRDGERGRGGVGEPVRVVREPHLAVAIHAQGADERVLPPDRERARHARGSPPAPAGGSIRSVQPRAVSTARTLPSRAVTFPASSSTTKRTPTPAAPANWSCRRPCARRVSRTTRPTSRGVTA